MKKLINFAFAFVISIALISCFDSNSEVDFEVATDAYVLKKNIGDDPAYAVAFYAFGNKIMHSATVTEMGGSGEKISLSQDPRSLNTMSKIPQEGDYFQYPPATSDYKFEVISADGVKKETNDFLSFDDIALPVVTKAEFTDIGKLLDIEWTNVEGADGFLVKILTSEGTEISNSSGFEPEVTGYTINIALENWVETPEQGKTYAIQVHAFAFEPSYEEGYQAYNIQEVAIYETDIVWP